MRNTAESHDGSFKLFYRKGWAYLTVYPPGENGMPVYAEQIQNRMKLLNMPVVGSRKILDIIETAEGRPEPLVEWPEGAQLTSRIRVEISEDKMSAYMIIDAPKKGAGPPTFAEVEEELENQGVVSGIDKKAVNKVLAAEDYGKRILAAEGTAPVFGKTRELKFHFNTNRGKPWLEMDFDRINLKELNFIENVKKDDLLAELLPPVTAADGIMVTGERIPASSDMETISINAGGNTRLDEDGSKLYAAIDGNVRIVRGAVLVEPVIKVDNVNYETGNIRFDGTVVIKNSIADGFVVEAGGDIQVGKGVGRARLSAGGNILLKAGISGGGEGRIECRGNMFAKYIESSTLLCRGNAFIEEAVLHSNLTVWKHCVLSGRRSEIIGGSIIVGGSLWCKKLGSIYDTPTYAALGVPPDLFIAYREARKKQEENREALNKADEQLDRLENALQEGSANERILLARGQLSVQTEELRAESSGLKIEVSELRDTIKASRHSILVVEDTMYKGVTVHFGMKEYHVPDRGVRRTILRSGESAVLDSGYNPGSRPVLVFD